MSEVAHDFSVLFSHRFWIIAKPQRVLNCILYEYWVGN